MGLCLDTPEQIAPAPSTEEKELKDELEKCQYAGPKETPSMIVQNHHIDSSVWKDIPIVDTDIFINTPAKAGTTWTQEIVCQLLYNGDYSALGDAVFDVSIWTAMKLPPKPVKVEKMEAQRNNPLIA